MMDAMGLKQSLTDPCVFYKKDNDETTLIVICYVDDTMLVGMPQEVEWFKTRIKERFKFTNQGQLKKHLGVNYAYHRDENDDEYIVATMDKLVNKVIKTFEDHKGKPARKYKTPGTPGKVLEKNEGAIVDHSKYRTVVGQIMYLVTKIFPEAANAARELTRHFANPGEEHWHELERFVGYMKYLDGDIKLTYRRPKEMRVMSNVDSNYATNKENRKSVSGGIHTLGGSIVSWVSKTQKSTTLSSTEAEYVALSIGAQEVKFMQMLLNEIAEVETPGIILEDNTGSIFLVKNQQVGQRTKHIDIRYHFVRELWQEKLIDVKFVNSEKNESDLQTKNVTEELQTEHGKSIRNGTLNSYLEWSTIVTDVLKGHHHVDANPREDVEEWTDVPSVTRGVTWSDSVK
jgi:hypothetical protein